MGVSLVVERERRISFIAIVGGLGVGRLRRLRRAGTARHRSRELRGVRRLRRLRPRRPHRDVSATRSARSATSSPRRTCGWRHRSWRRCSACCWSSFRKLAPALPLQALYFVADAPLIGPDGGGRTAALGGVHVRGRADGLAKLGRRSIERVLVDRGLLTAAAGRRRRRPAHDARPAPLQPRRGDRTARRGGPAPPAAVPPVMSARVPEALAPDLAERTAS